MQKKPIVGEGYCGLTVNLNKEILSRPEVQELISELELTESSNTLHGADERILDPAQLSLTAEETEKRFQAWLYKHGFSSKEDYYRECDELNNSEW